ncbi:MAG: hypothetical protein SGJ00_08310 [bacterium]|nr:hypothetical protein [bacterium]
MRIYTTSFLLLIQTLFKVKETFYLDLLGVDFFSSGLMAYALQLLQGSKPFYLASESAMPFLPVLTMLQFFAWNFLPLSVA